MKYTKKTLLGNEEIVYEAKADWFIFVPGIVLLLLGFYMYNNLPPFERTSGISSPIGDFIIAIIARLFFLFSIIRGTISFINALIYKFTTELVVTTKRIVFKTGFIKRVVVELTSKQIESLSLNQSILGRIFNFGDINIYGTGGVVTPIHNIDNPLNFRNKASELIDNI